MLETQLLKNQNMAESIHNLQNVKSLVFYFVVFAFLRGLNSAFDRKSTSGTHDINNVSVPHKPENTVSLTFFVAPEVFC